MNNTRSSDLESTRITAQQHVKGEMCKKWQSVRGHYKNRGQDITRVTVAQYILCSSYL